LAQERRDSYSPNEAPLPARVAAPGSSAWRIEEDEADIRM